MLTCLFKCLSIISFSHFCFMGCFIAWILKCFFFVQGGELNVVVASSEELGLISTLTSQAEKMYVLYPLYAKVHWLACRIRCNGLW
ncbi:hypothetical protein LguiB_028156 [Lonicera macranthoides]